MEGQPAPLQLPAPAQAQFEPNMEKIKQKLLKHGVFPTPKILRSIRKKETQKHNRKQAKIQSQSPLSPSQQQGLAEEQHFQTLKREFKMFRRAVAAKSGDPLLGKPWERIETLKFRQLASESKEFAGDNLKRENLRELKEMFEKDLNWVLDNDVQLGFDDSAEKVEWHPEKRWRSEAEAIRVLVERLSEREMTAKNWKFVRIMKQSGLMFTEGQMLKILKGLGDRGSWRQAMSVLDWVYGLKDKRDLKSRFVYTKLLAILGKAGRPHEALRIFRLMLEDCNLYPDIAAYHSIAVTLGQAGLLKELVKLLERMRQKPSKRIKNMRHKNWDPVLEPDLVVYNAVLNACVPSRQWKGVFWVFKQLRKSGLKPSAATYGLAMEVMLQSGKYDLVHEFFRKMAKSGEAIGALTYKVLVRAFWEEGKISEAVAAVRNMEQRGVVGTASVYYELACCLCNNGRWQDAMLVVEKIKSLRHSKPLEITLTGLIISSMDGGHIDDCISIFRHMKDHCEPNIGTVNAMLKVYGRNDMFSKAKELFEETMRAYSSGYTFLNGNGAPLKPDEYTYSSMLEASATAHQWEYFEYVYKGMALSGCQLDQTKHAWVLVEASRAGKCHLLEHAFDSLLEAGEIPHPLFFTEMLIQAIVQSNYEKAIALINAMAYAPFHISERHWTDLFESNEDRISRDKLEKLLNALCNCNAASSEITVSNLSRALHTLYRSEKEGDLSSSSHLGCHAIDSSPLHGIHKAFDVKETENVPSSSASLMFENADLGADPLPQKTDFAVDIDSSNHSSLNGEDDVDTEIFSKALSYIHSNDRPSNLCIDMEGLADDWASSEQSDYLDEELAALYLRKQSQDNDVVDFQKSMNKVGGCQRSELPSASKILEAWKESREKDGIFFPFEHGKKCLWIWITSFG